MSCQSSLSNALVLLVLERWLFDLSSTATVGVLMYVYPPPWCAWDMIDPLTDNSDISAWYVTPRIRRCSTWIFSRCSSLEPRCCLLSCWHVMLLDPSTTWRTITIILALTFSDTPSMSTFRAVERWSCATALFFLMTLIELSFTCACETYTCVMLTAMMHWPHYWLLVMQWWLAHPPLFIFSSSSCCHVQRHDGKHHNFGNHCHMLPWHPCTRWHAWMIYCSCFGDGGVHRADGSFIASSSSPFLCACLSSWW